MRGGFDFSIFLKYYAFLGSAITLTFFGMGYVIGVGHEKSIQASKMGIE